MKRVIFFSTGIVALIVLRALGILDPIERLVLNGVTPLLGGARGVSVRIGNSEELSSVDSLKNQIIELEKGVAASVTAKQENDALKKMISYRDRTRKPLIAARVLGASTDSLRSMIVIDRGTREGVQKGSAVIVNDGVLVGKVAGANSHSSSVLLLNDSRSKVIATFATDEHPHGIVEGQFQLGLKMNLIPITDTVKEGTLLMTSGREQGIPPSLLIGTIASIQSKPTDLFQSALVTPSVSYDDLQFVSVIPLENEENE